MWLVGPRQPQTEGTELESQDCRYIAITILLILVEISVKVACRSTTATDCGHRAITMLLILVEVFVKNGLSVHNSHRPTSILLILMEVSVNVAVSPLEQQTAVTELTPCYLFWWKYL